MVKTFLFITTSFFFLIWNKSFHSFSRNKLQFLESSFYCFVTCMLETSESKAEMFIFSSIIIGEGMFHALCCHPIRLSR